MGLLSLPNGLSPLGYSQWWFPVFLGIIANVTLIPMVWISTKYKDNNLFQMNEILLGAFLGKLINSIIIIYGIFIMASVIERYLEMIQIVALPYRTTTIPLILLLIVAVLIAKGGIKSVARFCILTFFITGTLSYFLRWGIITGDITHILPLFNFTTKEFLEATKEGYKSFVGYELLLFFFPHVINQQKVFKQASLGIWITVFFYTLVGIVSVMHFSEWQLENLLYPILNLFKYVELTFIERVDTLGITFWVFLILSSVAAYLWVLKEGVDYFRSKTHASHLYIMAVLIGLIVYIPLSQTTEKLIYDNIFYFSYTLILWPILLCLLHLIRSRRKEGTNEN